MAALVPTTLGSTTREIDAVLDKLYGATDQFEAVQYAHELQQLLTEAQSEVVLYYRSNVRGVNPGSANDSHQPKHRQRHVEHRGLVS